MQRVSLSTVVFGSVLLWAGGPALFGATNPELTTDYAACCTITHDPQQGYFARGPAIAIGAATSVRLFSAWNPTSAIFGVYLTSQREVSDGGAKWEVCGDARGLQFPVTPITRSVSGRTVTEIVQVLIARERLSDSPGEFRLQGAGAPLVFRLPPDEVQRFLAVVDAAR